MKQLKRLTAISLLLIIAWHTQGQQKNEIIDLGDIKAFQLSIQEKILKSSPNHRTRPVLKVQVPGKQLELAVAYQSEENDEFTLVGAIKGVKNSSFFIKLDQKKLRGNIVLKDQKLAYEYFSDASGKAYIQEKEIDKVMCIEYPEKPSSKVVDAAETQSNFEAAASVYDLQSLPGAYGCVLLDFDGYYLPPGTGWVNGKCSAFRHVRCADTGSMGFDQRRFSPL